MKPHERETVERILKDVPLPRMAPARQRFDDTALADVAADLRDELARSEALVQPGMSVALGVGSRGLAELPLLVRITVDWLKGCGALPFIVPAMGSHGGATADGQVALLAKLGVTPESAGCEIRSSMEVVEIDRLPNGLGVFMDRHAMEADGIAFINRIKPHTSFSGRIESGLLKMLSIGFGKQRGAESCHALGFGEMERNVVEMAEVKLFRTPVLFGVATVENAYDRICRVEVVLAEGMPAREEALLAEARARMPRILVNPIDVLVVDRIGKEYSGTGADPNITGRAGTPFVKVSQQVGRMVYLGLSEKSGGNATGLGLADIVTTDLFEAMDLGATYANHLTSTVTSGAKVPMMMPTDRLAVQAAVKTCNVADPARLRAVRVPNSLHLGRILISESLLEEVVGMAGLEVEGPAVDWPFDAAGRLAPFPEG